MQRLLIFLEKESTTDKFLLTNGVSTKGTFYYNKTRMSKMSKQPTDKGDFGDLESTVQSFKADSSKVNKSPLMKKENSSSSGYGKQSNFELISPEIMDRFNDIIQLFEENDWKKRISALKSLSNFIQEEKIVWKSKKFFQIVDVIAQWLKDNNSKVVTAAQDIFSNIMVNLKNIIEKGAAQIIEALSANVISSNTLISTWGQALMKKLVLNEELEWYVFIQPMWHQVMQENVKAKSIILSVLSDVVEIVYELKPVAVTKYIYNLW